MNLNLMWPNQPFSELLANLARSFKDIISPYRDSQLYFSRNANHFEFGQPSCHCMPLLTSTVTASPVNVQ